MVKHSSNIGSDHWEMSNLPCQPARVSTQKGPQLLSWHLSLVLGLQEETRPTPAAPVREAEITKRGSKREERQEEPGAGCSGHPGVGAAVHEQEEGSLSV